jgi:hypothetical protein
LGKPNKETKKEIKKKKLFHYAIIIIIIKLAGKGADIM